MPPPQEESRRSLLTRSDFVSLDVPMAKLCAWIGDGWLEQVGTAPTADGSTGEPVYAIISHQLRAELLPKLEQIGRAEAALTPIRARSQLLRLMLARRGILLPFDHDDDIVSVKTRLIEELAAGLLGPDLARALEAAAADLEREVEATLQQLDGRTLPEVFGAGLEEEPAAAPESGEAEREETADLDDGEVDDGEEEAEWFDTEDLLDETSIWTEEEEDAPLPDAVTPADGGAFAAEPEASIADEVAAEGPETAAAEVADAVPGLPPELPPEPVVAEVPAGEVAVGDAADAASGPAQEMPAQLDAPPGTDDLREAVADAAPEPVVEEAPDAASAEPPAAPVAEDQRALVCGDAVMAEEQAVADDPDGEAAARIAAASNDERVTEDELASLAGASSLLDFGVTFRDGLTEEDVAERLVPQVAMAITDTLVAMLGDENAPLAGALAHHGSEPRVDLGPLTKELEQLRLAMPQPDQRREPAVDLTAVTRELEQMRAAVQQVAERPKAVADLTPVTQELAKLCSLVELLADRRGDPPGLQKIASALELGFARVAAVPAEVAASIKQIGATLRDAKTPAAEAIRPMPAPPPQPLQRGSSGLVPVAAIGLLLACWAVVLYVKFGDARLALGSLLAVSMIGSTLVAFRRD